MLGDAQPDRVRGGPPARNGPCENCGGSCEDCPADCKCHESADDDDDVIVTPGGGNSGSNGNSEPAKCPVCGEVEKNCPCAKLSGDCDDCYIGSEYCSCVPDCEADSCYDDKVGCICAPEGEYCTCTNDVECNCSLQWKINTAYGGSLVKLRNDVELIEALTINTYVTLDLNGFTLEGNGTDSVIKIGAKGHLVLEDSSANKTGTITGGNATNGGGVYNAGLFEMKGGTITNNTAPTPEPVEPEPDDVIDVPEDDVPLAPGTGSGDGDLTDIPDNAADGIG